MNNKINFGVSFIDAEILSEADGNNCFIESVFFSGNGRMGARGFLPTELDDKRSGLFIAGVFGSLSDNITDFVNLPTPICERIFIDGKKATLDKNKSIKISLNLKNGEVVQSYYVTAQSKNVNVLHRRFFSMQNFALLFQKTSYIPNSDMELSVQSGINTSVGNCPVHDDQTKENKQKIKLVVVDETYNKDRHLICRMHTVGTDISITQDIKLNLNRTPDKTECLSDNIGAFNSFHFKAKQNETIEIEKNTLITTSRDAFLFEGEANDYQTELEKSLEKWSERLETADIEIEGNKDDQCAIRYAIFQLIANCCSFDSSVNIGARGLTHTRYKGCFFWDTDIFMLPFYLNTHQESAKSLVSYRANTLPQAEQHAKKMSSVGARYPWMASFSGDEQCETWDIGASELHITCDVVFAIDQYIKQTGDMEFYKNHAVDIYIKTARFWLDRYTKSKDGADLLFCKGPDEYCGITTNNLFTNMFVKHNLTLAENAGLFLLENGKEKAKSLGVAKTELDEFAKLRENIKLPKDKKGRYLQDDTFHMLEDIKISDIKTDDKASYHNVCFDRLQRYKVIKQADTILLMTRMQQNFSIQEMLNAWEDFEPLCLHDSTLSFATHAFMGALIGEKQKAEQYLKKALYLDLCDVMGNTGKEGLHLANFGETYNAVVFGFLGLRIKNDEITFDPKLPASWKGVKIKLMYKNKKHEFQL